MKYTIEFELPDNDTVLERIEGALVNWSVWGYSGYCKARPTVQRQPDIIRCADCYHYAPAKNGCDGICAMHGSPMDSLDWCSRAERKENR